MQTYYLAQLLLSEVIFGVLKEKLQMIDCAKAFLLDVHH